MFLLILTCIYFGGLVATACGGLLEYKHAQMYGGREGEDPVTVNEVMLASMSWPLVIVFCIQDSLRK